MHFFPLRVVSTVPRNDTPVSPSTRQFSACALIKGKINDKIENKIIIFTIYLLICIGKGVAIVNKTNIENIKENFRYIQVCIKVLSGSQI